MALAAVGLWAGLASTVQAGDAGPGGFVGLEVQAADGASRAALGFDGFGGVLVRDIAPGGPGEAAGLRRGDLLLSYEGVALTGLSQLVDYMSASRPGQTVSFDVWRHGRRSSHGLTLDDWPAGWRDLPAATAAVPRLGLTVRSLTPETRDVHGVRWGATGIVAIAVEPAGPAAAHGLRTGDLIVAVGRQPVVLPDEADEVLSAAGDDWMLLVDRGTDVRLIGPGAPAAEAMVAAPHVLAVPLADGPYVLDASLGASPVPRPGARLPALPKPAKAVPPASAEVPDAGLTVAALSEDLRQRLGLRWSSQGAVVTAVAPDSVAHRAGLAPGHVIAVLNQTPVAGPQDLADRFAAATAEHVLLVVETRKGFQLLSLRRTPEEREAGPIDVKPVFQFGNPPT